VASGILLRHGDPPWTLDYDGRQIPCAPGESVAEALLAAGELATTRSLKFRRHRGPYCLSGDCGTCLARVDGEPNVRTCLTPAHDGQKVVSQNRLVGRGPDPSALADKFFAKGMDHHHLMVRPRALNEIMKEVARNLAGLGTLPDRVDDRGAQFRHEAPDVVVIGRGQAGRAASHEIRRHGLRCITLERMPSGTTHEDDLDAGVFGIYPDEGLICAAAVEPRATDRIFTLRPRHLVVATGARDPMILIDGNDTPGVVSARGLAAAMARQHFSLPDNVVVIGPDDPATLIAQRLEARHLRPEDVERIEGSDAVRHVRLTDGTRIDVSLVVLAPQPGPASELARQAGASVRWNGAGFEVQREHPGGRVLGPGPWTLWAAGEVAGVAAGRSAHDGQVVAQALCHHEGAEQ